ncbi:MAG TPA: tetratricopeptide repeat protein [Candidatus Obscuribacterales bacterium]
MMAVVNISAHENMKRVAWCAPSAGGPVVFAFACACALALYWPASASEVYTVNGKEVSRQVYEAQRLANQGAMLLRAGKYAEASVPLQRAVEMAPELASAQYNLGLALGKLGKTEEATERIEQAVALDKDLAAGWLSLAGLYQSSGKLDAAIATYKAFVKQFPQRPEVPRVNSILKLLERQFARQSAVGPGAAGAQLTAADNYLSEVTKSGVRRWPDKRMPLRVFIEPAADARGYRPAFPALVKQCFLDWQAASGGRVSFQFVAEPSRADITCSFTGDRARLKNPAEGAEALTYDDQRGSLVKARIILLCVNLNTEKPRTDNQMRLIALHEVGHALGLNGHSTNPSDVMFYSNSFADIYRSLSARDCQTVRLLYAESPGTTASAVLEKF